MNDKIKFDKTFYANLTKIIMGGIAFYLLMTNLNHVGNFLSYILSLISPFLLGIVLAFVTNIPMSFFENNVFSKIKNEKFQKFNRPLSYVLSIVLLVFAISALLGVVIPQLVDSFMALQSRIPLFLDRFIDTLKQYEFTEKYGYMLENYMNKFNWDDIFTSIEEFLTNADLSSALNTAKSVVGGFTTFFTAFVFSIYMLMTKEKLVNQCKRLLYSTFSKSKSDYAVHIGELTFSSFKNFIVGQVTDAIIIAVLTFIVMNVMRMPYSPMISALVGFTDLIPIIGPLIGTMLGAIFILIENPMQAFVFVIVMIILQQIQGNIIYPRIVGDKVGLPSMWTLFGTFTGGAIGGVVGMWTMIPILSIIYTLLGEYTEKKLREKEINI